MTLDAGHLHPWPRRFRRWLGLPQQPCVPLDYSGDGRVRACMACLLSSPNFKRQIIAARTLQHRSKT